jgi:hypothetical protein
VGFLIDSGCVLCEAEPEVLFTNLDKRQSSNLKVKPHAVFWKKNSVATNCVLHSVRNKSRLMITCMYKSVITLQEIPLKHSSYALHL